MKQLSIALLTLTLAIGGAVFADEIPGKNLVLDLDAARGVEVDPRNRVLVWRNQVASFAAKDFIPNDKGRKVPGSGIPSFLPAGGQRKFPTIAFRQQELINGEEDAFDHLTKGSGHTWYVILLPFDQTSAQKNTHAIFGNLRNTNAAGGGTGGQFEGFWGTLHDNRRVYAGVRNGVDFTRNNGNNPEVLSKTALEKNRFYLVAGRMASGTGTVKVEVFVNTPVAENAATVLVSEKANPSKMAVGQERDATNHPGAESCDAEIARLLIFDSAHSDAEMAEIFTSLIRKYGIVAGK
jgi:hypothetical protein